MSAPRIVLTVGHEHTTYRVVVADREDQDGVLRPVRFVERSYVSDVDAMGVRRWTPVDAGKGASMSDWITFARALLDHALAETE